MGPTLVKRPSKTARKLKIAGLFAGIGGIELGFHRAGHRAGLFCEIEPAARAVLKHHFPRVPITPNVKDLADLGRADVLAAGFPCQDLSQAGGTAGIGGSRSGLVAEVFRLLGDRSHQPRWLLLENVPFMLQLERGQAMRYVVEQLEALDFMWAYRVIDAQAFGIPQRRQRVILLASRTEDPRRVLFRSDAGAPPQVGHEGRAVGFYWTEGLRGLGWAVDGVPTLKGGSTVGIPSPPAIWMPDNSIVTPDIRDAERLQGFDPDWTLPAAGIGKGLRWKLVGNAVSVSMSSWVSEGLDSPSLPIANGTKLARTDKWPTAAWGRRGTAHAVEMSTWPVRVPCEPLQRFLRYPTTPLSERATRGFLSRLRTGSLHYPDAFRVALERHLARMEALREVA